MSENSLGVAIVEGAWNSEVKDLAVELGELKLDTFLDEGVLKEIPLLKSVIACRRTWAAIHDQLFLKKVFTFLLSYDAFRRLAAGIDHGSIADLKALAGEACIPEQFAEPYPLGLVRCGFASLQNKESVWGKPDDMEAKISALGDLFRKCIQCAF